MNEIPAFSAQATLAALAAARTSPGTLAQLSVSFGEAVPAEKLRSLWSRMAAAHPILRSSFRGSGSKLVRVVHEASEPPWKELDWREVPVSEIGSRWAAELAADAARPLDASVAPALRFLAITLPGGSTHVLLTFPRYLLDEESLFFLLCEWIEGVEGAASQNAPETEEPPKRGGDTEWWAAYLEGAKGGEVGFFGPGDAEVCEHNSLLDRETTRGLQALCQKLEIAPSTLFLGAWGLLVARLCAMPEALVLAACEDPSPGTGFRTNFLPARIRPENGDPVSGWLQKLDSAERKRASESGTALCDLPIAVEPCFPAAFCWMPPALNDRIPEAFPRWINLDARLLTGPVHPLELEVRDGPRYGLRLRSELLPARVAANVLAWLEGIAAAILADPDGRCGSFAFGEPGNLREVPKAPPVTPAPVQDTASETASDLPLAVAVEDLSGAALTTSEIEAHASRLAGHLAKENLAGGWAGGICLSPSPWVPVAILGVLRAGDTCVPLDPTADPSWLAARAAEADCEFVICDSSTAPHFEGGTRKVLVIDRDWELFSSETSAGAERPKTALFFPGTQAVGAPPIRAFSPEFLSAACNRSARLLSIGQGDRLLVPAGAPGGTLLEGVLCACVTGATAVLCGPLAQGSISANIEAAKPTHLRLTAAEFRAWVAELEAGDKHPPEALKVVLVDAADGFTAVETLRVWQKRNSSKTAWRHFLSPCSFAGVGLLFSPGDLDGEVGLGEFLPAGSPTRLCGFSFVDPAGGAPPAGFPGEFRFAPLYCGSPAVGWLGWREASGQYHLLGDRADVVAKAALAVPGVIDAAADPVKPGAVWFVGSADGAHVVAALRQAKIFPAVEKAIRVPAIPLKGGFADTKALDMPRPKVAQAKPASPRSEQNPSIAPDAGSPRNPPESVPSATSRETEKPSFFSRLAGEDGSPALFLLLPDGGDPAPDCAPLAGHLSAEWQVFSGVVGPSPSRLAASLPATGDDLHFVAVGEASSAAIELVTQLRRNGRRVPYFVLVGAEPPHRPPAQKNKAGGWFGRLAEKFTRPEETAAIEGPCGIVLTDDSPDEEVWLAAVPQAATERVPYRSGELFGAGARELAAALGKLAGFSA